MKNFYGKLTKISLLVILAVCIFGIISQVKANGTVYVKNLIEEEKIVINSVGEEKQCLIGFGISEDKKLIFELVGPDGAEGKIALSEEEAKTMLNKPEWKSSNKEIVVVNSDGLITSKGVGDAKIIVNMQINIDDETSYNLIDECIVTVVSKSEENDDSENVDEEYYDDSDVNEDENLEEDIEDEEIEEGDPSKLQPVKAETPKYGNGDLVQVGDCIKMTDKHWRNSLYISDTGARVKNQILYSDNLTYKVESITNINRVKISYQGKDIGYIFWMNSPVYFEKVDAPGADEPAKDFVDINNLSEEKSSSSNIGGGILEKIKNIVSKIINFILEKLLPGLTTLFNK